MHLRVIKIGRIAYPEIRTLAMMYQERLGPLSRIESLEAKDDTAVLKLLKRPAAEHPCVLLDEKGKELTSIAFAETLRQYTDDPGVKTLTFIVGGPMGLGPELRREARLVWSLSKATFTSDLAWLLLWEQLYRAYNILKGTGYHHA